MSFDFGNQHDVGLRAYRVDQPVERAGYESRRRRADGSDAARRGATAEVAHERPIGGGSEPNARGQVRREPGSSIGTFASHSGQSFASYDSSGMCNNATVGTPKSAVPRTTIAPTPI